jgi:hypothetical protein
MLQMAKVSRHETSLETDNTLAKNHEAIGTKSGLPDGIFSNPKLPIWVNCGSP